MNLEQMAEAWTACAEHAKAERRPIELVDEFKHRAYLARLLDQEDQSRACRKPPRRPPMSRA